MSVCNTITSESLDIGRSFSLLRYISMGYRVRFVYECHDRVKLKVIGAKKMENLYSYNFDRQ